MKVYKEVEVNLAKERARITKGTGVRGGFSKREAKFLHSICDLFEAGDFVGIADLMDKHPQEWREWIGLEVRNVLLDIFNYGYKYYVQPPADLTEKQAEEAYAKAPAVRISKRRIQKIVAYAMSSGMGER